MVDPAVADRPTHGTADRQVFGFLNQHFRGRGTGEATVYYQLNAADLNHADRVRAIGAAYAAAGVPDLVLRSLSGGNIRCRDRRKE